MCVVAIMYICIIIKCTAHERRASGGRQPPVTVGQLDPETMSMHIDIHVPMYRLRDSGVPFVSIGHIGENLESVDDDTPIRSTNANVNTSTDTNTLASECSCSTLDPDVLIAWMSSDHWDEDIDSDPGDTNTNADTNTNTNTNTNADADATSNHVNRYHQSRPRPVLDAGWRGTLSEFVNTLSSRSTQRPGINACSQDSGVSITYVTVDPVDQENVRTPGVTFHVTVHVPTVASECMSSVQTDKKHTIAHASVAWKIPVVLGIATGGARSSLVSTTLDVALHAPPEVTGGHSSLAPNVHSPRLTTVSIAGKITRADASLSCAVSRARKKSRGTHDAHDA